MSVLSLILDQGARLNQGKARLSQGTGSGRLVDTAALRQAMNGSGGPRHG